METTIYLHPKPGDFAARPYPPGEHHPAYVTVEMQSGDVDVAIFLNDVARCDALIKAAVEAKRLLLGDDAPKPDLAAAEADPANPYGSSKHGRFDAGSAAEVAEGAEPEEARCSSCGHTILKRTDGHGWVHAEGLFAAICSEGEPQPAPIIVPFQHLPHLPQHVGGNPMCSLCGLDHYALHAIETTGGAR